MSGKLEILWSPNPNKFITWASEICLYEVQPCNENHPNRTRISNTNCAHLSATNTNYNYIKCLDIYPKSDRDLLLAVGQQNGKVTLSAFESSEYDVQSLPGKEFVPRQARPCNTVLWNPLETNLLAVGLDKHRSDNSVLLWDIMKYPINTSDSVNSGRFPVNTMAPAVELAKPVVEFGIGEVAHSLSWFHGNSKLMAVGMNMKTIKLIDFRDTSKIANSTVTKAVYGVSMNPHDDRHLASFFDNQICIWDTRSFDKPVLVLPHVKHILKIEWSPTRYNLLGSLLRDSSLISLYDIQRTMVGTEEVEPSVLERVVAPGSPHNITSFSWHKTEENKFLTIALSGTITDYTVFDRITLNWAPTSTIVWTHGRRTLKYIKDDELEDISTKMRQRAIREYGLKEEFYKNAELVDTEMLANAWSWLSLSNKLVEENTLRGMGKHPGVQAVLKLDPNQNKSETISISWSDLGHSNCHGVVKLYKHEDRDKALQLCSWHFDRDSSSLTKFIEQLEKEGECARAAAIAIFSLKIKLAIDVLNRAPENMDNGTPLSVVAMALAGFSDDKNSMWRQFCSMTKHKLNNPYLKAIFAYLTSENYNYDLILNETGIAVDDRVAFACVFLPDHKLHEYLKKLSDKLIDEGNLDGLLLTGNNSDGIRLLQRYLDSSGDVQSSTLIAIRAFHNELVSSENVKYWINSYRNLLDTWQLWNERAYFDIMMTQYRPSEKPPKQIFIRCNFCGKTISTCYHAFGRGRGAYSRMAPGTGPPRVKMSACPHCRKPLPRCAICLLRMGTTTELHGDREANKIAEFSDWFTWCQTCRHGGHASHMVNWFAEHSDCPVTGCPCRCFSIDAVQNILPANC